MKYEISVIIPVYNGEKYIERCVLSILNQNINTNYEIIIIDDGSTDQTEKICKNLQKENDKCIYYKKANGGVSETRNYGIKKARGKWIAFIDADDFVTEDYLSTLYNNSKDSVDFVIANHFNYYSDNESRIGDFIIPKEKTVNNCIINILSERLAIKISETKIDSIRTVWGKLYKSEIIKKNKIEFSVGMRLFEDGMFNLLYLSYIKNINFVDRPIYYYVQNSLSATKKYQKNLLAEDTKKIKIINDIIYKKFIMQNIELAYKIFKFNLFTDYLLKDLYNIGNNKNKKERIKELKYIKNKKIYGEFNLNIHSYLSFSKKIVLVLMSANLYFILDFFLNVKKKEKVKE